MSGRYFDLRRSKSASLSTRLNKRVVIQSPSDSSDGGGGVSRSWVNVATVWAEIDSLSGKETLRFGQLQTTYTHRIMMRYRDDMTSSMRIVYDGRVFEIQRIHNVNEESVILDVYVEEIEGVSP